MATTRDETGAAPETPIAAVAPPMRKPYARHPDLGITMNSTARARLIAVPESPVTAAQEVHDVVRAARAIVTSRIEPAERTVRKYTGRLTRLEAMGDRPRSPAGLMTWLWTRGTARTASDWGVWRAALLWKLDTRAARLLQKLGRLQRTKAQATQAELLGVAETLRQQLVARQTLATMLTPPLRRRRGASPKKRALDQVERLHERRVGEEISGGKIEAPECFMEAHWKHVNRDSQYAPAIAVSMVSGARTGEVTGEVLVRANGDHVFVVVRTLKVGVERQNQEIRALKIADSGPARFLRSLVETNGGNDVVITRMRDDCLRRAMVKAGKRAFPTLKEGLTPSVYRHALRTRMLLDGWDQETIAMAMGHGDGGSQSRYGLHRSLRGGPQVLEVASSRAVHLRSELDSEKIAQLRKRSAVLPGQKTGDARR